VSEEKRESKVLRVLMELMSSAANGARLNGERSAFFQIFDAKPDEPTEPEIHERRLGVEEAREFLAERLNSGFAGVAGFTCIQQEGGRWMLRSEVFETGTNVSASACVPLKRSLFGKFRPTQDNIELGGFPSIPGAFTSKADAESKARGEEGGMTSETT
jgi:hypothetical protein